MVNHEKRFLTIKEFCEEARISRTTVFRHLKSGVVPFKKIGSRILIPSSTLYESEYRLKEISE
ncbi:MAG: helix-turn-helix transcriptional regulator [Syntrophorhabdus sp.]